MIITILGSGTCVPSLKRSSCAVLVQCDRHNLLFDCGSGTIRRLLECEIEIFDISHIFLSHFHPDHSGELPAFLFANKYPDKQRRRIPLNLVGGKGLNRFYKGLLNTWGKWIELPFEKFTMIELDNTGKDSYDFNLFRVFTAPVAHNEESIAYRVTDSKGCTVVYSGDTDESENLVKLAENADIFICESAMPDGHKIKGHLTPSAAGAIAHKANVKKLVLTHFYPECDQSDVETQCRKTWAGPLVLAHDLMTVECG
ncbi:MBL fold metallo-hydrolase [Desulfobacterales bacterium HSG16]|nr:MBL fold metallo-hydrolase [Desulfobacterales bacterium HSG16]